MALTKLPGSKWWIETDDATGEIIGTYNKAWINADIAAITETLKQYPNLTQQTSDVDAIIKKINLMEWTDARKARSVALVESMYRAFQTDTRQLETAQLVYRLNDLTALVARLV